MPRVWTPRVRTAMLDYAAEDVENASGSDFDVVPPCSESDESKDEGCRMCHPVVSC